MIATLFCEKILNDDVYNYNHNSNDKIVCKIKFITH